MKIFLTGGTGFIGGHVIEQALAAGHQVTAIRRRNSASRRALAVEPDWLEAELGDDCIDALRGHDVFIHLAAHTANPPYDSLQRCLQWNLTAPLALAEQALTAGLRRFVVAGTCFEYGVSATEALKADSPLCPNNNYAISKAAASVAFLGWARTCGVRLRLMRLFHIFGEGEPEARLWPSLRRAALSGADFPMSPGEQVRDFVPVREAARQLLTNLSMDDVPPGQPQVTNVGTGQPQTLLQFADYWWHHWRATGRLLPGALPYRPGEAMLLVPATNQTAASP